MSIENLTNLIQKLKGIGPKSAKRIVLNLIRNDKNFMFTLAQEIINVADNIQKCQICQNLDTQDPCKICHDDSRDQNLLCVVQDLIDLWAIEKTNKFHGKYFILNNINNFNLADSDQEINKLIHNFFSSTNQIKEVIIATNGTIEGQTIAYFIAEKLKDFNVKITRLAFGLPIGSELDFLDEATIETALNRRQKIEENEMI